MESSKHSDNVIALGKRIVTELNLEPSVDTLGRWIAHYIAELIDLAEKTKEPVERAKAQEKCCATIEQLWQHRSSLPPASKPLSNIEAILKAIESFRGEQTPWSRLSSKETNELASPWIEFIGIIEDAGLRASQIALLTAIAEASFGKEKRWLEEHGSMLSAQEKKLIEALDMWLSTKQPWYSSKDEASIADLLPESRSERVMAEIAECLSKMVEAGAKLRKAISQKSDPKHSLKKIRTKK